MNSAYINIYDIILHTPIGEKKGVLSLQAFDGKMNGYMNILGHTEPCHGTFGEHGICEIKGRMVTLIRDIDYSAHGTFDREKINLTLHGKQEVFQVTGVAQEREAAK